MADILRIEPDHAGFQRVGDAQRAAGIRGPDIAGEAILHVIGDGDGIRLVPERDHREERTEHFLLRHAHAGLCIDHQSRLHIMSAAGTVIGLAADGDGGAVLPRDVEIAAHLGMMPRMDQRADFGPGIERVADLQCTHAVCEFFDECVSNRALDQQPAR